MKKVTEKQFSELSKEEKRIVILKDALALIKGGSLKIDACTVLSFPGLHQMKYSTEGFQKDLKSFLETFLKEGGKCTVCERGALLVATVLRDNRFLISDVEEGGTFSEGSSTDKRLMEIFDANQLALMECELMASGSEENERPKAIQILENAIKNKGIFKR
jgi:hypothetical protein